jgi:hypothetical protein
MILVPPASFSQSNTNASSTSEVSGRYISPDGEVEITLPADWRSVESTVASGTVIVSAPTDFSIEALNELDAAMYLIIYEKALVDRAPDSIPPFSVGDVRCVVQVDGSAIVSNAVSKLSTFQCRADAKEIMVRSVLTETFNGWVSLMLVTNNSVTESYTPIFNKALGTLLVTDAISMDISPNVIHTIKTINVNGTQVFVEVRSSSNLTDFVFDEERAILSFALTGRIGTQGVTEVAIGKIIEGPYSVMINDNTTDNFELIEGATREGNRIIATYDHNGITRVTISGTRAVPEFSNHLLMLSAIALVLSVAVAVRRSYRLLF